MDKRLDRYVKLYPWFYGLTADLLFYIAVDSLFLRLVKSFSAAEIVSITSLSMLICIILQYPALFIIKKIGNTASTRLSAFLLLISALLITFGHSYVLVLIGRIFHDISGTFRNASVVALENNLDMADRKSEFISVRTSANTVYAVITMIISFVASFMFNLHNYLPMIGCITTCTVGFILSLFMKDCSSYNKISYKKDNKTKVKVSYNKIVVISLVLYSLFYTIVSEGQSEGKLFIQDTVLLDFDEETTALIIGAILAISRIIRVLSNLLFVKLYSKYQEKIGVALPVLLTSSVALMFFGSFIPHVWVKIAVMAIGYTIILFIRDPFRLYIQDVLFAATPKEQHQTLLTVFDFGVKIATAGIGLAFAAILTGYPMVTVIGIMFVIGIIEIILSLYLYRAILVANKQRENAA